MSSRARGSDETDAPSGPDGRPRGRGRPSRSAAEIADVRARIADCALRLFQQEGYAAVSMRKLAAEAGCTTKTVYAYFDSKIDILSLLWSEVFAALFDQLDAVAAAQPEPKARLEAISQAYVGFWLEHREHYFLVFMSRGLSRAEVEGFVATGMPRARFELFIRCLAAVLGPGADEETLRQRSEALICALNGISQALITISGHDWAPPESLVRIAVDGVSGRARR
jgi:AcrR family transcriptional regulator